ncbi:MAG: helix-turn-helix domain-containing protein [Ktedonobacterales bacterium]|nr:helix-turn-helix domain-containing protein [Ktedonobacterales bacterium]
MSQKGGALAARKQQGERLRALVRQFSGARHPAWIAAQTHRADVTAQTVRRCAWRLHCTPTKRAGWYTANQAARLLYYTPQWVSHLCRVGRIAAHRNPGGRTWLIAERAIREFQRAAHLPAADLTRVQGRYFVTPHAVRRFQERVRDLSYPHALALIIAALNDRSWTPHPLTDASRNLRAPADYYLYVTYQHTDGAHYHFRATISEHGCSPARPLPKVVTLS